MKLNIKPGSRVIESGTGSGSLSCSLAWAVGPRGRLYTFEFNKERAVNGQNLFKKLGLPQTVCIQRDVYAEGFLKGTSEDEFPEAQSIDAIFLDLP